MYPNPYGNGYGYGQGPMYPPQQGMMYPPQQGMMYPGQQPGYIKFAYHYKFNHHAIDTIGRQIFFECDFDRSGTLDRMEGRIAVNRFCQMQGMPHPNEYEYQMLFSHFDYDGSGMLDYGEFRMLLEHMGGIRHYTRQDLMGFRCHRNQRIGRYRQGCNLF